MTIEFRMSDAQWAAHQASLAFQDGRFALGEAFGRLALKAHIAQLHQDSTMVRMAEPTPASNAAAADTGFLPSPAETQLLDAAVDPEPAHPIAVPPTARCMSPITRPGPGGSFTKDECHEAAWWDDHRWRHVDPGVDQDHWPVVDLQTTS